MELDTKIKLAVYRHFAETGRPPSAADVAAHTDSAVDDVLASYRSLHAQRVLVPADDGSIIMEPPFSGVPTLASV